MQEGPCRDMIVQGRGDLVGSRLPLGENGSLVRCMGENLAYTWASCQEKGSNGPRHWLDRWASVGAGLTCMLSGLTGQWLYLGLGLDLGCQLVLSGLLPGLKKNWAFRMN